MILVLMNQKGDIGLYARNCQFSPCTMGSGFIAWKTLEIAIEYGWEVIGEL